MKRSLLFFLLATLILSGICFFVGPGSHTPHVYATDDYQLLVPLPIGANNAPLTSLPTASAPGTTLGIYIRGMYQLFIALSAVIAVVMIVYGGILYMSTDAIYNKSQWKAIIIRTL